MSFRQYLPSKQFATRLGAILIIAGLLVGTMELFGYLKRKKQAEGKIPQDTTSVEVSIGDVIEVDADQDGVRDWEEVLYGTDPDKKETIAGTPDKVFVDGRKEEAAKAQALESDDTTETAKFAQEFLSSIIAFQQAGLITEENADTLTDSFFEYIKQYPNTLKYTEGSLTVIPKVTPKEQSAYLTVMNSVFLKNPMKGDTSIISVGLTLRDGNTKRLGNLPKIAAGYEGVVKSLANAKVPQEALGAHLKILNGYDQLGKAVRAMEKIQTDPLPGFIAITRYQSYVDMVSNGLLEFKQLLPK